MIFESACHRYHRLANERDDRLLTDSEEKFMTRHEAGCKDCREFETQSHMALNMLRQAALEPVISDGFSRRVTRRTRLMQAKDSVRYWTPALIGASIACACVVATLALLTRTDVSRDAKYPLGQARANSANESQFPDLRLNGAPSIDR